MVNDGAAHGKQQPSKPASNLPWPCQAHDMIPLAAPRGKDCWREESRDAGVLVMTVWEAQWGVTPVPSPAVARFSSTTARHVVARLLWVAKDLKHGWVIPAVGLVIYGGTEYGPEPTIAARLKCDPRPYITPLSYGLTLQPLPATTV